MIEIDLRFLQGAFLDFQLRFRLMERRLRLVEFGLRRVLFRDQFLHSPLGELREFERGPGVGDIAFGLRHARLENRRIDLCHYLSRLHRRIKIDKKLLDVSGNLAADLHVHDRVERAGGGDRLCDRAACDGGGLVFSRAVSTAAPETEKRQQDDKRRGGNEDDSFHEKSRRRDAGGYYLDRSDRN